MFSMHMRKPNNLASIDVYEAWTYQSGVQDKWTKLNTSWNKIQEHNWVARKNKQTETSNHDYDFVKKS